MALTLTAVLAGVACGSTDTESPLDGADADLSSCPDDGNPCTRDVRFRNRCTHPALADGTSCPQGTCVAGACVPNAGSSDGGGQTGADGGSSDAGTLGSGDADADGGANQVYIHTYHVRTNGSDTACNGLSNDSSSAAPNCAFSTIQKGINTAQPGDLVSVHAGDYSSTAISSARSGTATSPITVAAAPGEVAVLGTKIGLSHDHIVLKDFHATHIPPYPTPLFDLSGSFLELRNNYIYSDSAADFESSYAIRFGGTNNIFDGNTVDGRSTGPSLNQPSIWIVVNFSGSGHHVSHNTFKNFANCERVFEVNAGSDITITENEVFNMWEDRSTGKTHVDIFQSWLSGAGQNYIVERNYFHDIQGQMGVLGTYGAGPFTIRNNVFANITSSLFMGMSQVHITNNTFYRVGTGQDSILYAYDANSDISGFVFMNNILYATGASDLDTRGIYAVSAPGSPKTMDYNFVANGANQPKSVFAGKEAHGVNGGDPVFAAPNSNCIQNVCNFQIGSTSAAKDKGTTLPGYSTDYAQKNRVVPWDIGAYEY